MVDYVLGREKHYADWRRNGGDASWVMRLKVEISVWVLSLSLCAGAVALSFLYADLPIAHYISGSASRLNTFEEGPGSDVILSAELVTVIVLCLLRLIRGTIPPFAKALAVACLSSICAYGIDNEMLKCFFGVPTPSEVMHGARHAIDLWNGSPHSSFPSGHMALAAAFAGVFIRLYRASVWPFSLFLLVAACLLVTGGWHFLSDVIAGTVLGLSGGLVAGHLLAMRSSQRASVDVCV